MTDTTNGADLSASDDFAAFEASIDNPATEVPAEEPKAADAEPEPAPSAEGDGDKPSDPAEGDEPQPEPEAAAKPKKTAQQRIDELTWKAAEAERREQAIQKRLEEALAGKAPPTDQRQAQTDGAPDPNDYEFGDEDAAYIRDHARFEVRQEMRREFDAERQREQADQALAKSREAFSQRKAEAFPDGDPDGFTAFCALPEVPTGLNDIIMVSEVGPQLADYYGANKNELERLSALPLHLQVYEIAKVEGRLAATTAAPAQAETTPPPKPKIATDAPSPAPQVRGSGGQFKVSPDTDDFSAFEKAY
ncbi:hypothetical protein [Caulobacter sp. FWC2]|uniref:hypothetical protein n=1 Tax=Caulobacter sp. FWC2 TaxID=69664 RepID=UPI000C157B19|nr:hypothetical protein [Caulobacter sp. FWC2]PIB91285.1 hypothetical protein CSW62_06670 [Caulobacter sp. FWC2]